MIAPLLLACAAALSAPAPTAQDERSTVIEGRVLLPGGAPAAGATWSLTGKRSSDEYERMYGRPEGWEDLTGAVGDDGRVDVRFESHMAFQYTLTISLEGHARSEWWWGRLAPGTSRSIGDLTLRTAGSVTGTIVDADGNALTGTKWTVEAEEGRRAMRSGERNVKVTAQVDPETGTFTIDGLPPGAAELRVLDLRFGTSKGHRALVVPGKTTTRDIVFDELESFADSFMALVVPAGDALGQGPDPAHIWLVSESGERRNPVRADGGFRYFTYWRFDEVGDGAFRLEIDDPDFDPWVENDVRAGQSRSATVTGSAAIRLDVRAPSGELVTDVFVRMKHSIDGSKPRSVRRSVGDALSESGLLDNLVPGDYSLQVAGSGGAAVVDVPDLGPGEVRDVKVELGPHVSVAGVVRFADGAPAQGVLVRLVTRAEVDDSPTTFVWTANTRGSSPERARHEKARALTDASGRFRLTVAEAGPHLVMAGDRGKPSAECEVFDTSEGAPPQDVRLEIARPAFIEGRVLFPSGLEPNGRGLIYVQEQSGRFRAYLGAQRVDLDTDGRFRAGPMASGRVTLRLLPPGRPGWSSDDGMALGTFDVRSGETKEVSLDYNGAPPARIEFDLTPNELGDERVRVAVTPSPDENGTVIWSTTYVEASAVASGRAPRIGPLVVEPGVYDLWHAGDGWVAHLSNWRVAANEERTDVLDLDRWERRVRFVHVDEPVRGARVYLANAPVALRLQTILTDAEGRAVLDLGAGRYEFRIQGRPGEPNTLTALVDWPLGEGVEDVVFR